jgi:hypothetical protein
LYLSQIPTFKHLPAVVNDLILDNLKTRYYAPEEIVHFEELQALFVGIIYLGEV